MTFRMKVPDGDGIMSVRNVVHIYVTTRPHNRPPKKKLFCINTLKLLENFSLFLTFFLVTLSLPALLELYQLDPCE